jgi:hypothetical protein
VLPSPNSRRVGIRIITFETCSGFTRVTARLFAQPPKAAFVTRLQHSQLPDYAARQLPDLSTNIWVDSSSTGDPRLSGRTGVDVMFFPQNVQAVAFRKEFLLFRRRRTFPAFCLQFPAPRRAGN